MRDDGGITGSINASEVSPTRDGSTPRITNSLNPFSFTHNVNQIDKHNDDTSGKVGPFIPVQSNKVPSVNQKLNHLKKYKKNVSPNSDPNIDATKPPNEIEKLHYQENVSIIPKDGLTDRNQLISDLSRKIYFQQVETTLATMEDDARQHEEDCSSTILSHALHRIIDNPVEDRETLANNVTINYQRNPGTLNPLALPWSTEIPKRTHESEQPEPPLAYASTIKPFGPRCTLPIEPNQLRIATWNATGLKDRLDDLVGYMDGNQIHIMVITETWYRPSEGLPSIVRSTSSIAQLVETSSRSRGHAGVSVIINPWVKSRFTRNVEFIAKDNINGSFVVFKCAGITFIGIYRSPSSEIDTRNFIDTIMNKYSIPNSEPLVLLGDFNCRHSHWGDTTTNYQGLELEVFSHELGLDRVDPGPNPTFIRHDQSSIPDHIFSNVPFMNPVVGNFVQPANEYHLPVITDLLPISQSETRSPPARYRLKLEVLRDENIAAAFQSAGNIVCSGIDQELMNHTEPWPAQKTVDHFDKVIRESLTTVGKTLLGERRIVARRTFNPITNDDIETARRNVRLNPSVTLQQVVNQNIRKERYHRFREHADTLSSIPPNEMFKSISSVIRSRRKQHTSLSSSTESIKSYRDHFKRMYSNDLPHPSEAPHVFPETESPVPEPFPEPLPTVEIEASELIDELVDDPEGNFFGIWTSEERRAAALETLNTRRTFQQVADPDPPRPRFRNAADLLPERIFDPEVISSIIAGLTKGKTPGPTGFQVELFKYIGRPGSELLSSFFVKCWRLKKIPSSWTRAQIVPVPKKGDLSYISNYRPISLTEGLRKIFEHCLLKTLELKIHPIHPAQGGFRPGHCCNDLIAILQQSSVRRCKVFYAFLDIKAAYDSVDRTLLWEKCTRKGIGSDELTFLKFLFDTNSSSVLVDGFSSDPFRNNAGVLQGSVLSPFLYSIFIDDLPRRLDPLPKVSINNLQANCLLYADDVVLFAQSPAELQALVEESQQHAIENRFRFNVDKCVVLAAQNININLHGKPILQEESFRYLGVDITTKGIDVDMFLERRIMETLNACNLLSRIGLNSGGLSIQACFISLKLEASLCNLPLHASQLKSIESAQQKMM